MINAYGKEGVDNHVVVKFGDPGNGGNAGTITDWKTGVTTVTFDLDSMKADAHNSQVEIAGVVGHEGVHVRDQKRDGMPQDKAAEKATERRAFGVQAYINEAFDHTSVYGLWNSGWPDDKATQRQDSAIEKNANRATQLWCQGNPWLCH